MTLTRLIGTGTLVALLISGLSGCSTEDGATPDPTPSSTSGSTPTPTPPSTEDPEPPAPAIDFDIDTVKVTIRCTPYEDYLHFDHFTTDDDVELVAITAPGASGTTIGRSWVADSTGMVDSSGNIAVDAKGTTIRDEPAWADRERVRGAEITAGTSYTAFVEMSLDSPARIDGLQVAYLRDGVRGTATWPLTITRARNCP